jgi:hypothetical protein
MAGRKVLDRIAASYLAQNAHQPGIGALMKAGGGAIPIVAAGGEYVVPPEVVVAIRNGDLTRGHNALDSFVKQARKDNIQKLRRLPGPRAD